MSDGLLEINKLDAFYGDAQALFSLSMSLSRGEMLALIGANGAGKSTLLKSIAGLVRNKRGAINYKRKSIIDRPAFKIVTEGIALVPEGRRLFPSLSVEENLLLGGKIKRPGIWNLTSVYELFPVLRDKRNMPSTLLSGGQQQMVAIGRALMSNPRILLCDEISLGLAPIIIADIYAGLPQIKAEGSSVILVEQDIVQAMKVADRVYCFQEGRLSLTGRPRDLTREQIHRAYFGS
jgi:branched-chain amino acid transport system ATP-binding protein